MAVLVNETCATDPATGTKKGDCTFVTDHLRMQTATNFTSGQFEYTASLGGNFYARWDAWAGGGSGADMVMFYWGAADTPTEEGSDQDQYAVVLNEFADQIQIRYAGANVASGTSAFANLDNSTWRTVEIYNTGDTIRVLIDSVQIFNLTDSTRTLGGTDFGWTGRSGGTNNEHRIKNLYVEAPQPAVGGTPLRMMMGIGA